MSQEILKKLFKIATQQQKILSKLAQSRSDFDSDLTEGIGSLTSEPQEMGSLTEDVPVSSTSSFPINNNVEDLLLEKVRKIQHTEQWKKMNHQQRQDFVDDLREGLESLINETSEMGSL